jgi:hypothetical protein
MKTFAIFSLFALVMFLQLSTYTVEGHDREHGEPCDETEPPEGEDHDHTQFCNPGSNLVCTNLLCTCEPGYSFNEMDKKCASAACLFQASLFLTVLLSALLYIK